MKTARTGRFSLLLAVALTLFIQGEATPGQTPAAPEPSATGIQAPDESLVPGKPLERELKGGETHRYSLRLPADQFLSVVVEQKGIDVAVRLVAPDGKRLIEIDSPNGTSGPEPLAFITSAAGDHVLEVASPDDKAPSGRYEIVLKESRAATTLDRELREAEALKPEVEQLYLKGRYAEALPKAERDLDIRERAFGPEHPQTAAALTTLAMVYRQRGDFVRAESLFERALAVKEKTLGPQHPDTAYTLYEFAVLHAGKGNYAAAETLYRRAAEVYEKAFGPDDPRMGAPLNGLGGIYQEIGDHAKAEAALKRALAVYEKSFGPDHAFVATVLNQLALLYRDKGDGDAAESSYRRVLAIYEKTLGPDHPFYTVALTNLAALCRDRRKFDQAEPLFRQSVVALEKRLGPQHPDTASALVNLGEMYRLLGKYEQSEPLYLRALEIREKTFGEAHPRVVESLDSLGVLYQRQNKNEQAEPLYRKALSLSEKIHGPDGPLAGGIFVNLAVLHQVRGDIAQAVAGFRQASEIREREHVRNLTTGSERQRLKYLSRTAGEKDVFVSFHLRSAAGDEAAARVALTTVFRRKGRALDAMANSVALLRNRALPEDRALLDQLTEARAQLSALLLKGPGRDAEKYQATRKALEEKAEKLEIEVAARSAEFRIQNVPITLENIQKAIPGNTALVEFTTYRSFDPKTWQYGSPRYAVYVLTNRGDLKWTDLGDASTIEKTVAAFRVAVSRRPAKPNSAQPSVKSTGRAVDALVMQPVRRLLDGTTRWLIAPDGVLNLVPFEAFVDERGKYLIESHKLSYLTSGRDLLRLHSGIKPASGPVIFADPDFGNGPGPALGGKPYPPLPRLRRTAEEAALIKALFPEAALYTESQAAEERLKQVNRPSILHIATHGYFLENAPGSSVDVLDPEARGLLLEAGANDAELKASNSLLRSWVFLAGANRPHDRDPEDGTLTALEAANLNLFGTKLVSLSACDSGIGEIDTRDGVFGLRRALVLAGSESQLISLWSVSDTATRDLMARYYKLLKAGGGRADALREVQLGFLTGKKSGPDDDDRNLTKLSVRKIPRIRSYRHPYYWAGFVLSGDWTALD